MQNSKFRKNYLYKKLAPVPINQVNRAEVIGVLRWMRTKGLSRSSIEQTRNVISGVCEFAIDGEYITENPCVGDMRRLGMPRCKSRKVDMSDQLYFALKRLSTKRKEEALKEGLGEPVPIIFHTQGEHTSQNSVRNIWRRLLTKCELNYRKLHTTRHTFASMLIANGESLAYVKELYGPPFYPDDC